MISRNIESTALELFSLFPILSITGPRQSGKTTLVKNLFKNKDYVSLEDIDQRTLAKEDPRGFLSNYPNGAILDEVQQVPELFSYLQSIVDEINTSSQFVLSGSQNFLLMRNIGQSLSGRVGVLSLLPLSQQELQESNNFSTHSEKILFDGSYPAVYSKKIPSQRYYSNYVKTYLERDVRDIINIGNLEVFQRFIKLCAGRVGQPLNYSSLAADTGVSLNTIKSWISILINSYIIFLVPPYHKNFNKRLIKMPKMYFFDTGLLSYLLGINKSEQIDTHFMIGNIFENYIISDIVKYFFNKGLEAPIYFWKDNKHKEIDLIIDKGDEIIPIEIKSSKTYNLHQFDNLNYFEKMSNRKLNSFVISRVEENQKTSFGTFVSWKNLADVYSQLV